MLHPQKAPFSGTANQCTAALGADICLYFLFPVFLFLLNRLDMRFACLGVGYVGMQYRFSQTVQQRGVDHLLLIGANQTIEVYRINQRLGRIHLDSRFYREHDNGDKTGRRQFQKIFQYFRMMVVLAKRIVDGDFGSTVYLCPVFRELFAVELAGIVFCFNYENAKAGKDDMIDLRGTAFGRQQTVIQYPIFFFGQQRQNDSHYDFAKKAFHFWTQNHISKTSYKGKNQISNKLSHFYRGFAEILAKRLGY